jgi:hypothetical protein
MFGVKTHIIIDCDCLYLGAYQDCELEANKLQGHFEGVGSRISRGDLVVSEITTSPSLLSQLKRHSTIDFAFRIWARWR